MRDDRKTRYEYVPGFKTRLRQVDGKGHVIHLLDLSTLIEMRRQGLLIGQAKQDAETLESR